MIGRGIVILLRPERVEAALWRGHAARPDAESRQKLFEHYRRFAERIAHARFARRQAGNFDRGDVRQLAYEALLQAIDRFDPARGAPFEAYARIRINGHIGNGLAQTSEASAQHNHRMRVERERMASLHEGFDPARDDPLATLSGLSATIAIGLLLESELPADVEAIADPAPSAYDSLAWNELVQRAHQAIDGLPEREAYVMRQHYRNGVSFQQIAGLLGVTRGRVSQIHRAALERLRGLLARLA